MPLGGKQNGTVLVASQFLFSSLKMAPVENDALQNTKKYPIVCSSINITFDTELCSELCASPG